MQRTVRTPYRARGNPSRHHALRVFFTSMKRKLGRGSRVLHMVRVAMCVCRRTGKICSCVTVEQDVIVPHTRSASRPASMISQWVTGTVVIAYERYVCWQPGACVSVLLEYGYHKLLQGRIASFIKRAKEFLCVRAGDGCGERVCCAVMKKSAACCLCSR